MRRLGKFFQLSTTDQWLLVKSTLLLVVIRLGLWLLPFQTLRRLLSRLTAVSSGLEETALYSVDRVVWAVEVAGRYVPRVGSCLTQALTIQAMLARRGHPTVLRIGVVKDEGEKLQAHSWLESGCKVLIGGSGLERCTPLPALDKGEGP
jgi:hypothetical protein